MQYEFSCLKDRDIYKEIENKTLERLETLVRSFERLTENNFFSGLHLNIGLLFSALQSYHIDLLRTKCFHNIKFANSQKKAAYTIKWLVKIRPIMIDKEIDDKQIDSKRIIANEIFAFIIGISYLNIDLNNLSNECIKNMIYMFRYRDFDCLVLSSYMYLLECASNQKNP